MTRRLPPEVEKAMLDYTMSVDEWGMAGRNNRLKVARSREAAEDKRRLIAAILAACDAAERRGIERAAAEADRIGEGYAALREATLDEDHLVRYWAAHAVATTIRALPVPEEGA